MVESKKYHLIFALCMMVFLACAVFCVINIDSLKKPPFQQTTTFSGAALAKFEKDGNIYVIDSGAFRLVCMAPDKTIRYSIDIDKRKEYTRIIDCAIDDAGSLYIYAVESEHDNRLTKRDMIRKYDNSGRFIKDILSISYDDVNSNPRLFFQFGSLRCENGMLGFSRTEKDRVILYQYDTFRDELQESVFTGWGDDYLIAQLVLKDMNNFAYTMRNGDIFEVTSGGEPELRASFNWSEEDGGIIPWFIQYDTNDNLVFFDMAGNSLYRIAGTSIDRIVSQSFFEPLITQGELPALKGFGFYKDIFAGVFGDAVWLYDGTSFTTYEDSMLLPFEERLHTIMVQSSLILGILALAIGLVILFFGILDRYVSLFIKQTIVIIPLLIIAFIVLFSITFNIMMDRLNELLFNEIRALAVLSANLIDGDDIDNIKTLKDCGSDSYKNLSNTLKQITGNNKDPWNQGYYAALYKGSRFEYCLMLCNDSYSIFQPTAPLEDEDYDIFMSGKPIGSIFDMDDGVWAVAVAPVYNSANKISGMIEIGIDIMAYELGNMKLKREVTFIAALICLVILLALIILISIIVKQLSAVAGVLGAIAGGDHTERVRYRGRDELGKVSRGLNRMAEELQRQFNRITKLNESTIRFVPVQFMEHLGVADISNMNLGDNVQRIINILFFDIRAFSINSEMMTAKENFEFINKILGITGPIIRKHNGFVDKFIGDAAMALFDNGLDAVSAAVELYNKLVLDPDTKVKIGADSINIGVGIHTGSVMMGIVGENERLSSTVISANVNLASRVESLSKQTGSGVLITKDTLNQLTGSEDKFAYRFIGMVQAAGVNEVVGLFDMLDALPERDRRFRLATKKMFESGVRRFHTKDYAAAALRFEKVVTADPKDICAEHYLKEAQKRLKDPSLPSVFIFDKK